VNVAFIVTSSVSSFDLLLERDGTSRSALRRRGCWRRLC